MGIGRTTQASQHVIGGPAEKQCTVRQSRNTDSHISATTSNTHKNCANNNFQTTWAHRRKLDKHLMRHCHLTKVGKQQLNISTDHDYDDKYKIDRR